MARNLDPFLGTYGLPPSTWLSDEMIINSMPIMEIIPSKPVFESGLNLFRVQDDSDKYLEILNKHGFDTPIPIRAAFLADNFPTDSFTNDYGETFLQKFTDVASMGMSQLAQMTGSQTGTEAIRNIGTAFGSLGENVGGTTGSIISGAGGTAVDIAGGMDRLLKNMQAGQAQGLSGLIGGGANLINKMVAGHRVDFPQVWRNSGYTPSYTATIRLYNPHPGNYEATLKYITGPLAVFLLLALPRSDDGRTYNWPFFHKIKATGIYNLDPCVITNMTVVKGGDQQQIAYNQKLAIVDLRIDFTSLYNSILVEEGNNTFSNRPTLRSYLDALNKTDGTLHTKRANLRRIVGTQAGAITSVNQPGTTLTPAEENLIAKNEAARRRQAPQVEIAVANGRAPADAVSRQALLASLNPGGL